MKRTNRAARRWVVFALAAAAGIVVTMMGRTLLLRGSAPAHSAGKYKITAIADIELRDKSPADTQYVLGHLLGLEKAFTVKNAEGQPTDYYKVNDYQYLAVVPGWSKESERRFLSLGFRTNDARALEAHLAAAGFHPQPVSTLADGNLGFSVKDPEGNLIRFVQYLPDSKTGKLRGKLLSPRRISKVLIHAGYQVTSKEAEDKFYSQALHFPEMWWGGMKPGRVDWFDRRTPDGPHWLEYMLGNPAHPSLHQRAVLNHFSLGVYDMQAANRKLIARGWKPTQKPQIGLDGKWQLNLYTAAGTRIELMGPHPVKKPCCSPMKSGGW